MAPIYMSQLYYERGWVNKNSLVPHPLASISSNKGQQSLPPGTLVLLAGLDGHSKQPNSQKTKVRSQKDTDQE